MARFKDVAPHLLQRLVNAAVVNAPTAPMEYAGGCGCGGVLVGVWGVLVGVRV